MGAIVNNDHIIYNEGIGGGGGGAASWGSITGTLSNQTDLQTALNNVTAVDITPKSNAPIRITHKFVAQTTGGDADIKNGAAYLYKLRGSLNEQLNPFVGSKMVSTSMNLYDGTNNIIPVVRGAWGEYGTTQANNGYVVLADGLTSVEFCATKNGTYTACPSHTENGINYYLPPSNGYLKVTATTIQGVHIAWSNVHDSEAGEYLNSEYDLSTYIALVHSWGLAGIVGISRSVFDELDLEQAKAYKRIDRVIPTSSDWVMTTETTEQEGGEPITTYVFTYTCSAFKSNGLWQCLYSGLASYDNKFVVRSTTITSVADLVTDWNGKHIYYELATEVMTSLGGTLPTNIVVNDYGLTYFIDSNDDLVSVPCYADFGYHQGGKDQLFNNATYVAQLARVVASAMNELDLRIKALEEMDSLHLVNLIVDRKASINGWNRVDVAPTSSSSEGHAGDYYIGTSKLNICVADNTWKSITIGNF